MLSFHSFKELFLFLYNKNGIGKMLSRATIHRGVANRIPRSSATFFTSPPFCMHWRIARLSSSTRWNIDFFLRSVVFSIRLFVLCGKGKPFSAFFQFHSFKDLFCWKRIPSLGGTGILRPVEQTSSLRWKGLPSLGGTDFHRAMEPVCGAHCTTGPSGSSSSPPSSVRSPT